MVTPSTLAPGVAKKRTATVVPGTTVTGGSMANVVVDGPFGGGTVLWNAGPYGIGVASDRFQISMIGWPWYATFNWKIVEPDGIGNEALSRLFARLGCTPVLS